MDAEGGTVGINGGVISSTGAGIVSGGVDYVGAGMIAANVSIITITSGSISDSDSEGAGLVVADGASVMISGGMISGGDAIDGFGSSVTVRGGTITGGLQALGGSTFLVSGGNISADGILASGSIIDLFGTFYGHNSGDRITSGHGNINGTLQDGEAFYTQYNVGSGGTIEFNVVPAPEPSQFAALGIGVFGLGALALRARRRIHAA